MKRVFRRPSPAMVVAIVALIAALGGTAVGAAFVTKKQSKKIAANQVNKLAPGLSVASAKNADNATNAGNATTANSAKNVLFASVDYNDATPAVVSGTPGIVGNGEAFLGAPRLTFPRDTTNCAVTANLANGGTDGAARWSGPPPQGVSDATNIVVVMYDQAGANIRSDYTITVVCPA